VTAAAGSDPSPIPVDFDRAPPALNNVVQHVLSQPPQLGLTQAIVVLHRGVIIAEGYGPDVDAHSTLISWSMGKSMTHALVALLVDDGRLALDQRAPIREWANDARSQITVQHLLNMRSGLTFIEDYVDDTTSHCIDMLFGAGKDDVAGYAANLPLEHPVGDVWSYASGTTNILCRIAGEILGGQEATHTYLRDRLFEPIGIRSAIPKFDAAGTFIGSSFVYATARDFARFGELYRNDGVWNGHRVLQPGWRDHARTPTAVPPTEDYGYGAHWWLWQWPNSFAAHGYEGQRVVIVPDRDLVVVRLGKTPEVHNAALRSTIEAIVEAVPLTD
jgi:CubicO group peptidase (beta-lactamase class C family)